MGSGFGAGKRRAIEAAEMAISSPLLEDVSIEGATGILINITGGPDLTLHEVNEAASLIQNAAHEDANIIFGSVIDPNITDEVRITVIATGVDKLRRASVPEPRAVANTVARNGSQQVTLPYDAASQITKEYPPPQVPPRKASATVVEDADVDVSDLNELTAVERALAELGVDEPVPEVTDGSVRMAYGSGPSPVDGNPLVHPHGERHGERKKALPRPSLKSVLAGELEAENELDVPTFIRRHNASQP